MINQLPVPTKVLTRRKPKKISKTTLNTHPLHEGQPSCTLNPRKDGTHTSYAKEREAQFAEGVEMELIYLREPEWDQPWHKEVGDLLRRRYEIAGWSRNLFMQDFSMLRVICGDKHPRDVFLQDLEEQNLERQDSSNPRNLCRPRKVSFQFYENAWNHSGGSSP